MTVASSTAISNPFAFNGSATTFPYPFRILSSAELVVLSKNNTTGVVSIVSSSDYSVTGVGDANGGNVVWAVAPASGSTGYAIRATLFTQLVNLVDFGEFSATSIMQALDRACMRDQQMKEVQGRSLRGSVGETWDEAPGAVARAEKVLTFDEDGLPDYSISRVDVAAVAAIAGDIDALGDLITEIEALYAIRTDISAVAAVDSDIETCADNIAAIQAAPTQATNAANSATAAASSASSASSSASTATTQASNASTSATNAAASATTAANEATAAATSESNAASSASAASSSASSASTSATNASNSATAAAASATAAAASETSIAQALSGVVFEFDSGTTDADPGAGNLRFNNATLSSVTELYVSETDDLGASVGSILSTWDDSTSTRRAYLIIRKRANPTNYAAYWVTDAQTDAGVYRKFTVEYNAHSGSFSDGDVLGVIVERTGDVGPSGPGSGDVLAANAGSEYGGVASTFRGNVAAAPNSADVLVKTANGELTAERVVTDTATIAVDWATAGQAKFGVVAGSIGATELGSDAVQTAKIGANQVTLAKVQQITTDRLLGRDTAGTGDVEQLTVGGGVEFTGSGGIQRSALTGDVTASAGSNATTIANNAVTTAKIADANVTLAKMANIATDRLIGRDSASTGVPEALTVGGGIEFTGSGGIQTSALTGDVTKSAGGTATTIAAGAVEYAMHDSAAIATAAELQAGTASKLVNAAIAVSAGDVETVSYAASVALDFTTFVNAKITLTGNITLSNPTTTGMKGRSGLIELWQDATGSRTVTWGANYRFAGGTDIVLTTTASAVDLIFYQILSDGTVFVSAAKDAKN